MKRLWIRVLFCACSLALAGAQEISLQEIRTASDTELVARFKDQSWSGPVWDTQFKTNQIDFGDRSKWRLDGQPVAAIDAFVAEADAVEYRAYLKVPTLENGRRYRLETPRGGADFVFNDRRIRCESIKINQGGYSALSRTRYANFAIWLGTGGAQPIRGPLPSYLVLDEATGMEAARGSLQPFRGGAQDPSSGDYVYRIDLSAVPEGGPYRISVAGYGCSDPFGVGGDFSRRLAYTAFRALYYQRCGCPLVKPYAVADIRPEPCHTVVYDSQSRGIARVSIAGTEPSLTVHGGYHDAGDADRIAYHMMVPIVLMTTYEVFPQFFSDDQFNIPDKFDAGYGILGKGNGIPDIIDEAEWGTMVWTNLQSTPRGPHGAVAWGDNAPHNGNPAWGINWDQDALPYGTETNDVNSCGLAAGMFMHLARLLEPYDPSRSAVYQRRADAAHDYCKSISGRPIKPTHELYYAIQKYLLMGDSGASNTVDALAARSSGLKDTYNMEAGGFAVDGNHWLTSYFMSYLIATNRPTNPETVRKFKQALNDAADQEVEWVRSAAYPVGWRADVSPSQYNFNQGAFTAQGQFAYPCLMQWAVGGGQEYIDAVCQLMDYNLGLNPLGKCYMTGIGFEEVHHPHTRESAYVQVTKGWGGPLPGITVYGPLEPTKLRSSPGSKQIPPLASLPRERCYADHLGFWAMNEFTVYQSEVFPAAIYPVLARGGKWKPANPVRTNVREPAGSK